MVKMESESTTPTHNGKEKCESSNKNYEIINNTNEMTNLASCHGKRNDPEISNNKKVMNQNNLVKNEIISGSSSVGEKGDKLNPEGVKGKKYFSKTILRKPDINKVEEVEKLILSGLGENNSDGETSLIGESINKRQFSEAKVGVNTKVILKRPDFKNVNEILSIKSQKDKELNEWSKLIQDIEELFKAMNFNVKWANRMNEKELNTLVEKVEEKMKLGYYWEKNVIEKLVKLEITVFIWSMVNNGIQKIDKGFIGFLDGKGKSELANLLNDNNSLIKVVKDYESSSKKEDKLMSMQWENWCNKVLNSRKYQGLENWSDWKKMIKLRSEMEQKISKLVGLITDYPSEGTNRFTVEFKRVVKGMKFLLYTWGLKQGLVSKKAMGQAQNIVNSWSWSHMCSLLLTQEWKGSDEAERLFIEIETIVQKEKEKALKEEKTEENWDWRSIRSPLRDRAVVEIPWSNERELEFLVADMKKDLTEISYYTQGELKQLNHEEKCVFIFFLMQNNGVKANEAIIEIFHRPRIRDAIWYINDLDSLEGLFNKDLRRIGGEKMLELKEKGRKLLYKVQQTGQMKEIMQLASKTNKSVQLERRKHEFRFSQIRQQLLTRKELQNQRSSYIITIFEILLHSRIVKGGRDFKTAEKAVISLEKHLSWEQLLKWLEKDNESFNRDVRNIIKEVKYTEWLMEKNQEGKIYPERVKAVKNNFKQIVYSIRAEEQVGGASKESEAQPPTNEGVNEGIATQSNDKSITQEYQDFLKDQEWIEQCDIMDAIVNEKLCRMLARYKQKWNYWSKQQFEELSEQNRTLIMLTIVEQLQIEVPILGVFEKWKTKKVEELVWLANNPYLLLKEYEQAKCEQPPELLQHNSLLLNNKIIEMRENGSYQAMQKLVVENGQTISLERDNIETIQQSIVEKIEKKQQANPNFNIRDWQNTYPVFLLLVSDIMVKQGEEIKAANDISIRLANDCSMSSLISVVKQSACLNKKELIKNCRSRGTTAIISQTKWSNFNQPCKFKGYDNRKEIDLRNNKFHRIIMSSDKKKIDILKFFKYTMVKEERKIEKLISEFLYGVNYENLTEESDPEQVEKIIVKKMLTANDGFRKQLSKVVKRDKTDISQTNWGILPRELADDNKWVNQSILYIENKYEINLLVRFMGRNNDSKKWKMRVKNNILVEGWDNLVTDTPKIKGWTNKEYYQKIMENPYSLGKANLLISQEKKAAFSRTRKYILKSCNKECEIPEQLREMTGLEKFILKQIMEGKIEVPSVPEFTKRFWSASTIAEFEVLFAAKVEGTLKAKMFQPRNVSNASLHITMVCDLFYGAKRDEIRLNNLVKFMENVKRINYDSTLRVLTFTLYSRQAAIHWQSYRCLFKNELLRFWNPNNKDIGTRIDRAPSLQQEKLSYVSLIDVPLSIPATAIHDLLVEKLGLKVLNVMRSKKNGPFAIDANRWVITLEDNQAAVNFQTYTLLKWNGNKVFLKHNKFPSLPCFVCYSPLHSNSKCKEEEIVSRVYTVVYQRPNHFSKFIQENQENADGLKLWKKWMLAREELLKALPIIEEPKEEQVLPKVDNEKKPETVEERNTDEKNEKSKDSEPKKVATTKETTIKNKKQISNEWQTQGTGKKSYKLKSKKEIVNCKNQFGELEDEEEENKVSSEEAEEPEEEPEGEEMTNKVLEVKKEEDTQGTQLNKPTNEESKVEYKGEKKKKKSKLPKKETKPDKEEPNNETTNINKRMNNNNNNINSENHNSNNNNISNNTSNNNNTSNPNISNNNTKNNNSKRDDNNSNNNNKIMNQNTQNPIANSISKNKEHK